MTSYILQFFLLLLMTLLVGTMFGVWIVFKPSVLSPATYVEQQQNTIHSLKRLLPPLRAVCFLLILIAHSRVLASDDLPSDSLFAAAAVLLLADIVVARIANQPIEAEITTWSAQAPPTNWMQQRDASWKWHIVRTVSGFVALSLTLLAVLGSKR